MQRAVGKKLCGMGNDGLVKQTSVGLMDVRNRPERTHKRWADDTRTKM